MQHLVVMMVIVVLLATQCVSHAGTASRMMVVSTVLRRAAGNVADVTVDMHGNIVCVAYTDNTIQRLVPNGTLELVAGQSGDLGDTNGVGGAAKFNNPWGITSNTVNNIAFVSDSGNNAIRAINLTSTLVTTLVGPTTAQPFGIVYLRGVLYAAGSSIIKIVVANAPTSVSYITIPGAPVTPYLCINRDGSLLYVTIGNKIV